jgi:hypothetical protein
MTQEISQGTKDQFINECAILRTLPKEVCLTFNFEKIVRFYQTRIGLHPVLESWEELRALVLNAIEIAKAAKTDKRPFHIRFAGGGIQTWLVMRLYALCVYEADAMFYAGDCIIKI